jgi:hypothetical protein
VARETSLWDWLGNGRHDFGDELHMDRVENLLMGGWPDVEGCLSGSCFTIELKSKERPARESTRILAPDDIRPGQVPWLEKRWSAGGCCYMLVQVGGGHRASRYLVPGAHACLVAGATEDALLQLSVVPDDARAADVIRRASRVPRL